MVVEAARETAGVTTRLIVTYVRERHGDRGVQRLLELAGEARPTAVLEDEGTWSTYAEKIALFEAAAEVTGNPQVARRMGESLLDLQLVGTLRLAVAALGSPQQVLRSIARANGKFTTSATMRCELAERGRGVVTYQLHPEHTPSYHDCQYTQGLLTQATVMFGLPAATIHHPVCQVEGDRLCRFELSWTRRPRGLASLRPRRRRAAVRSESEALRQQMLDLQGAVADVVSSPDLDEVLAGVARRAGAAVGAQQHVLVVRLEDEPDPRVHSEGLTPAEALRRGRELLAERGAGPGVDVLVAAVASPRQWYGYLAAYLPSHTGFLPGEQPRLDAYASLAALALDAFAARRQARRQASHDDLTGLANRALFFAQLEQALADHRRTGHGTAVCLVDLGGLRSVNDEFGHATGDELLFQVGRRLVASVRESDVVARLSGDEFGVLARGVGDVVGAERVATELAGALAAPFQLTAGAARISASVGVALAPEHGTTREELLSRSDLSMQVAKHEGGGYRVAEVERSSSLR
jgi:diguanylate cyclase (GGDEF)-like protein